MNGAGVISEARGWKGTRYVHQGRMKGVGVDCIGLILGVGRNCGVMDWTDASIAPWMGYARTPNPERMRAGLAAHLDVIEDPRTGDIAWLGWRKHMPMHLAILGELRGRRTLIHAAADIGSCVEHDYSADWVDKTIGWWRYRGLEGG